MPRLGVRRSILLFGLVFVVVIIQISLNLLLAQSCNKTGQNIYENKREHSISQTDIVHAIYTEKLRATQATVAALKEQLQKATNAQLNSTEIDLLRNENARLNWRLSECKKLGKVVNAQEFSQLKYEVSKSDFLKGDRVYNENAVTPFDSFTHEGIFAVNKDGLIDRPGRRPIGSRIREQEEILNFAVRVLKDEFPEAGIERQNLANGVSRLNRLTGMQYDLIFNAGKANQYRRVKISRPFSNLELVDSVESLDTSKELINLILPLLGRTNKFEKFLQHFGDICVRWDGQVYLTVVYFGKKDREEVASLLAEFEKREKFKNYKLIFEEEPFSRGVGLQKGVLSWEKGNNIMFFCDVDMYFNPDFFERCRFYTEPGRMVYYPIVFSLYNPDIVYNGKPPSVNQQLYIGKRNGFWRDFGFGMTCVYKNDFVNTGGFDTSIHGWGTEDLKLYRKFLRTDLAVIRATDRGIFHMYHPKNCDPSLPSEQYFSCLHSKAVTEASHRQMGMLAFGNRLFSNMRPDWKSKLRYQPDLSLRGSKTAHKQAISLWRRADEIDIEILEVTQLQNRLGTVVNFSIFGQDVLDKNRINVGVLKELKLDLENATRTVKKLAQTMAKNVTQDE